MKIRTEQVFKTKNLKPGENKIMTETAEKNTNRKTVVLVHGAKTTEVAASHVSMPAQPEAVAAVIVEAAETLEVQKSNNNADKSISKGAN
jgi:hypothetical protein